MTGKHASATRWVCIGTALVFFLGAVAVSKLHAAEVEQGNTLVIFYSKTGSTKTACQVIKTAYGADVIEIKDLVDRFTTWGGITGMLYTVLGWHTEIAPATVDVTPYSRVVIGTPIWGGTFPTALRTLIETNDFKGREVAIFSTSTDVIEKERQDNMIGIVTASGGKVVGYFQIQADRKVDGEKVKKSVGEIEQETRKVIPRMQKAL